MRLATITSAALLAAVCLQSAFGAEQMNFQESIAVESSAGRVLVHVTVDNQGESPVYVPRAVASEHELWGRLFEVRDLASGQVLEYTGPMVKRGPLTSADYLPVPPHRKHSNTLDITDAYAFRQGTHSYQLSYPGTYLTNVARLDAAAQVAPAPVQFTHTGR
ncbi:MAG: hypothetical protein ACJ8LG_18590 [Massilia sp.]